MTANHECIIVLHLKKIVLYQKRFSHNRGPHLPYSFEWNSNKKKKKIWDSTSPPTLTPHIIMSPLCNSRSHCSKIWSCSFPQMSNFSRQTFCISRISKQTYITDNIVYPDLFFVVLAFWLLQEAAKTHSSGWRKYTPQTWPLWKPFWHEDN